MTSIPPESTTTGLVIRIDARRCHVEIEGEVHLLVPRGRLFEDRRSVKNPIAVGDRVRVLLDAEAGGTIDEVLPRRNKLARSSAGEGTREQIMVANLDQVLVVASIAEPEFRSQMVDRIVAGAEREGLLVRIVLNKVDLEQDLTGATTGGVLPSEHWANFYESLGYTCLRASATTGVGIEALRERLCDHLTVLCGMSGVGKSSLLNAIDPELKLRVGLVSVRGRREGRHTTTHTSLSRLSGGGHVVDTPGVRNFGLFGLDPREVAELFVEMRPFLGTCNFDDCSHTHEPKCPIRAAVEDNAIAGSRYDAHKELLAEAKAGHL